MAALSPVAPTRPMEPTDVERPKAWTKFSGFERLPRSLCRMQPATHRVVPLCITERGRRQPGLHPGPIDQPTMRLENTSLIAQVELALASTTPVIALSHN